MSLITDKQLINPWSRILEADIPGIVKWAHL